MKRLLTLILVIGVLGLYGQTTEGELQIEADTTQNEDTIIKVDTIGAENLSIEGDTVSTIEENIESMSVSSKGNDDSLITIKKNPWLYDWRYGCLTDGLTYLIPMITLYSIAEKVDDKFLPLDNYCTPCIYPIGLVFAERMLKSIILEKTEYEIKSKSNLSICFQTGPSLPHYTKLFDSQEGVIFPSVSMILLANFKVKYDFQINQDLKLCINIDYYDHFYLRNINPGFISTSFGLEIKGFDINLEKVIFGYYNEISQGQYQKFVSNEYKIIEIDSSYIVNFKYDFWGVGIGWSKKYKIWKELYIEPMLSYKFIYTFDFSSGSIVCLAGGLGIGYSF